MILKSCAKLSKSLLYSLIPGIVGSRQRSCCEQRKHTLEYMEAEENTPSVRKGFQKR